MKILRTDVVLKAQVRSPRKEHGVGRGEIPGLNLEGCPQYKMQQKREAFA